MPCSIEPEESEIPVSIPKAERMQFKVGKYDVIAQPMNGSAHMLRYTVRLHGKRLGALASMPTESDCKFMESPPPVPPLKPFVYYRPGRPKKGAAPAGASGEMGAGAAPRDDLPSDAIPDALRGRIDE